MANGAEVAKAYVTIVPTMQGAQAEITKELTGVTDQASKTAGESGGSNFGANFASAIKGTATVITASLVAATTAAVGAAVSAGKAFIDAAKETASYGDTVDKTSQRLGISRQSFQELDYVLNLAGTSMDSMSAGFRTLTNQIDDAKNGSEEAQARFAALGISLDDLSTMSTEDIFKATITGFQDMEDSADRAALANDVFGRSGQQLAPLFNMTSDATREAIETANEYGMILSDEGVAASAQFTDSMTTMDKTVKGLKNQMMANFLPAMSTIMDGVSQIFSGDEMGADLIQTGITDLIGQINTYVPTFISLAQTILTALLNGFAPMMPQMVSSIFSFLTTALVTISTMMPQLTPVISEGIQGILQAVFTCLPIIISSLIELTEDLVTWLSSGNNVSMLIGGVIQIITMLADSISMSLPVLVPALVDIIGQVADELTKPSNINMILQSALTIIGSVAVAIIKAIPTLLSALGTVFKNILNRMMAENATIMSKASEFLRNLWNTVKSKLTELATNAINILRGLPSQIVSIGQNLVTGLWNGISNKVDWVISKIRNMGSSITSAIKRVFGIASPSKVFAGIGGYLAEGLGVGFEDEIGDVKADMIGEMNGLTASMNGLTASMNASVTANGTVSGAMSGGSSYIGGAVTINVYGAEGQDVNSLADVIAQKLEDMTRRKEIAYA